MLQKVQVSLVLLSVTLMAAESPRTAWMNKRIAEWNDQDARQILYDSPWVKRAAPAVLSTLNAYQRRDGGNMAAQGGGHGGVGFDDFSLTGTHGAAAPRKDEGPETRRPGKLFVRWESAMPIRAAEVRANESGAPVLDGDEYAIAVYDVSLKLASADLKGLAEGPKKIAVLKMEGKKDARPSRVAIQEFGGGMATVIYLFPRSLNLTLDDKRIEFDAQIGRISLAQYFFPAEMQFQGRLEL